MASKHTERESQELQRMQMPAAILGKAHFLIKSKAKLSFDPPFPLHVVQSMEAKPGCPKHNYSPIFIITSLKISKKGTCPKCPSPDDREIKGGTCSLRPPFGH